MSDYTKKITITISSEWDSDLDRLKQELFYKETQAEMFRYIIGRGLEEYFEEKNCMDHVTANSITTV